MYEEQLFIYPNIFVGRQSLVFAFQQQMCYVRL